jgi:GntR family transcriptional regulator
MSNPWRDDQPIWKQIRDRVVASILDGGLAEGATLPSVRQVAAELAVNPLTVSRAYQALADEGVIERNRGLGMTVTPGARQRLTAAERTRFLETEWPPIRDRIERLGIEPQRLFQPSPETRS